MDGGIAEVLQLTVESPSRGQTFITYNFEVAGFHTYFAGNSGVWVHNSGSWCQEVFSVFKAVDEKLNDLWGSFTYVIANPGRLASFESRWHLRMLNEIRGKHFTGQGGSTVPHWRNALLLTRQTTGQSHSASILRANLMKVFGMKDPGREFTAHHILMTISTDHPNYAIMKNLSDEGHALLRQFDIDVNDAANGAFLPNKHSVPADFDEAIYGPLHSPLPIGATNFHTKEYLQAVVDRLKSAAPHGKDAVRDSLQKIEYDIINKNFPGISN